MAPAELSSNWKKLQEKLKAPSSSSSVKRSKVVISQEALFKQATSKKSISSETLKRKAEESKQTQTNASKKQKTDRPPRKIATPKPATTSSSNSSSSTGTSGEKTSKMGAAHSQPTVSTSSHTISPSLHLWASEEGISTESLAEAYNLGLRTSSSHIPLLSTLPPAVPNAGLTLPGQSSSSSSSLSTSGSTGSTTGSATGKNGLPLPSSLPSSLSLPNGSTATASTTTDLASILAATKSNQLGKYISIDCEMVGTGPPPHSTSILARCSLVDFLGNQIYDSYVLPTVYVTDWRTPISGISPKHMRLARPFTEVQAVVAALLKGRVLVGHDVKHDLEVLGLEHPHRDIRDTAKYGGYKKYGHGPKPSLRVLAKEVLEVEIQGGQHSSVEDARVAMLLFRKEKMGFDMEVSNRYDTKEDAKKGQSKKGGKGRKGRK